MSNRKKSMRGKRRKRCKDEAQHKRSNGKQGVRKKLISRPPCVLQRQAVREGNKLKEIKREKRRKTVKSDKKNQRQTAL